MPPKKAPPAPPRLSSSDYAGEAARSASLQAAADALAIVEAEGARQASPILRDAAKVLMGVTLALQRGDADVLREGAKWARKVVPGGAYPKKEIVVTLLALVQRGERDDAMRLNDDQIALEATVNLIANSLAAEETPSSLYPQVRKRLDHARENGVTDRELLVKVLLRSVMSEADAGTAVSNVMRPKKDDAAKV